MNVQDAYNQWAAQYDTNHNKTRDLEAIALREMLVQIEFDTCLEIGCGTGKNTEWLITRAEEVLAVDLSEEMLHIARQKIRSDKVVFQQADITRTWDFATKKYDLIGFSLVLEHIEDLHHVFRQASNAITPGGYLYLGELHPFKQYTGTKARFETEEGIHIVTCFTHHISEFTSLAQKNGFGLVQLNEYFDEEGRVGIPRILSLLFKKA